MDMEITCLSWSDCGEGGMDEPSAEERLHHRRYLPRPVQVHSSLP